MPPFVPDDDGFTESVVHQHVHVLWRRRDRRSLATRLMIVALLQRRSVLRKPLAVAPAYTGPERRRALKKKRAG